jgi:hypothetical protein
MSETSNAGDMPQDIYELFHTAEDTLLWTQWAVQLVEDAIATRPRDVPIGHVVNALSRTQTDYQKLREHYYGLEEELMVNAEAYQGPDGLHGNSAVGAVLGYAELVLRRLELPIHMLNTKVLIDESRGLPHPSG